MSGPQAIAISDVMAFCAMAGMSDATDRMHFLQVVQAMDSEFIAWATERKAAHE